VAEGPKQFPVRFGPDTLVLWKTPLPEGLSSPCIWGGKIFLTGFDAKKQKLETLCLDQKSGAILWRQTAPAEKIESVYKVNSPAAATPATDGKHLLVSFGSYGLLCYDLDGKELWRLPLPRPPTGFGSASSPVLAGDLVLLNGQGKDLHLLAVNITTGKIAWKSEGSPFPSHYPVPVLWKQGPITEVVVLGRGGLLAFDVKDGSKRWWIPGLSPEATPTPTLGDGMLYVASHLPGGDPDLRMKLPPFDEVLKKYDNNKDGKLSVKELPADLVIFSRGGKDGVGDIRLHHMMWLFDKNGDGHIDRSEWQAIAETPFNNSLLAIRPGGQKDISRSHVVWQHKRGVPEVPSPLCYRGRIYMIRNGGVLTCLEAKTGKEVFPQRRLRASGIYYASPVAGNGKVYVASDAGVVTVLRAGNQFEVLSENDLGASIRATPALVDGIIYLRTAQHLYAFRDDG
jgi:outer membrane protein assembly factor BamB